MSSFEQTRNVVKCCHFPVAYTLDLVADYAADPGSAWYFSDRFLVCCLQIGYIYIFPDLQEYSVPMIAHSGMKDQRCFLNIPK